MSDDLFRKQIVHWVDAEGRRCQPGTPGATRRVEESRKWYGTVGGKARPLSADKTGPTGRPPGWETASASGPRRKWPGCWASAGRPSARPSSGTSWPPPATAGPGDSPGDRPGPPGPRRPRGERADG